MSDDEIVEPASSPAGKENPQTEQASAATAEKPFKSKKKKK